MKLRDLDAHLCRHTGGGSSQDVDTVAEADGVWFLCPKCDATGAGAHYILCWSPAVPIEAVDC